MTIPMRIALAASVLLLCYGLTVVAQAQPLEVTDLDPDPLYGSGWSAQRMLEADVYSHDGEEIGAVEDIVVGPDGEIRWVAAEIGGTLGLGDERVRFRWDAIEPVGSGDIMVPVVEGIYDDLQVYADPVAPPLDEAVWRASELIGDFAFFTEGFRFGEIEDVVFSEDGRALAVIFAATGGYGDAGPYAVPFLWDAWDREAETYLAPISFEAVAGADPFVLQKLADEDFWEDEDAGAGEDTDLDDF